MPARPVTFTRYCLTRGISKLPGTLEMHWVIQYHVNVALFRTKDLQTYEMTVKLKSKLYVGPVNLSIFLNFWHFVSVQHFPKVMFSVLFCCDLVSVDFTHILHGYFTGARENMWFPECQ